MASGNSPDFSAFEAPIETAPGAPDQGFQLPSGPEAAPVAASAKPAEKPEKPKPPKPPFSVYTLMLILSIVFLTIGCVMLVTELRRYNFEIQYEKPLF